MRAGLLVVVVAVLVVLVARFYLPTLPALPAPPLLHSTCRLLSTYSTYLLHLPASTYFSKSTLPARPALPTYNRERSTTIVCNRIVLGTVSTGVLFAH